ncbi:Hypothetical predicted protein [Lynx pardinus]|uniref:Uncharacterized protein n=1 Tax=Lynx pardinus TaxID=191816 RepID=A0A485MWG5_LYNPA|nr:Hypothetical predicted protein [Lynx pardinus]
MPGTCRQLMPQPFVLDALYLLLDVPVPKLCPVNMQLYSAHEKQQLYSAHEKQQLAASWSPCFPTP